MVDNLSSANGLLTSWLSILTLQTEMVNENAGDDADARHISLLNMTSLDSERCAERAAAEVGFRAVAPDEDAAVTAAAPDGAAEFADVGGSF